MKFKINLVGLNHRSAGVDVRERFALANYCAPESWAIPCQTPIREALILSTCNRVEILAIGEQNLASLLLERWASVCKGDIGELEPFVYKHFDLDAVRHVFEVASSLDSMVLGEPQILGQLKAAYRKAVESRCAGPILNGLMHKAFSVAKRVRHETAIAASAVSISYAAVELAKRIFGQMQQQKAMLIGAGEMAELAATHLLQAGLQELLITNRTFAHAEKLASRFRGSPVPFGDLIDRLPEVDIVIASTGAAETILNAAQIRKTLRERKNRPMFLIDIAVPRDIDPDVNTLDNVYLYDIDDLKEVVEENRQARQEEAARARLIIDEEVNYFQQWLTNLDAKPTILELVARGEEAARSELGKTLRKLGPLPPETQKALETMVLAVAKKLNHAPIMYLKSDGMGKDGAPARISAVRRIFNLDASR